jgi:hemolysin III
MFFQRRTATRSQEQIPAHRFPDYGQGERAADVAVHMVGVVSGFIAGAWLLSVAPLSDAGARGPLAVYVAGVVGMLAASATYNAFRPGPGKEWLRRIDHAVIFAAIAGTYTPLLVLRMPGEIGAALCVGMWSAAVAGAGLKLLAPRRYERLGLVCYLALGWVGLPAAPLLADAMRPEAVRLIVIGAFLYTLGVGVHLMTRLRYHNALWHVLVLAAAGCHFLAMRQEFAATPG